MNDLQFRLDSSNKNVEMLMEAIKKKDALIESLRNNTNYDLTRENKTYKLNHYRAFYVKFLPPTNYKPSRIKIMDTRHNVSKTLSYDNNLGEVVQTLQFLERRNIKTNGFTTDNKTQVVTVLTTNFSTSIL